MSFFINIIPHQSPCILTLARKMTSFRFPENVFIL